MEKGINTEKDFEIAKKIAHVLSGDCSEENRSSLDEWLSESEGNRNLYERILDERNREAFQKNAAKFDRSVGWEKSLQKRRQRTTGRQIQMHRRVLRWVAVVTLVCGVGVAAMLYWEQKTEVGSMVAQNEVVQGGTRAILTLADGKVVDLEKTKGGIVEKQSATNIFNQGGNLVYKDSLVQAVEKAVFNKVTVPRGGEFKLTLSDGTVVHLNSETVLSYPVRFAGDTREVELHGEAYFEVAKERERPFWVDFREGTVRVLGTQFNVKAYGGEEAVATLVHGKVEVARGQEAVVLHPGEQCRIAAGEAHALIVGKADLMSTLAWKNGEFVFKDASLEQVIDELARWYNVEMMYDHSLFRESRVHIYMNRSQTLDEALDMLSKAWNIRYERQGTKVWLGEWHTGGTDSD